MMRILQRCALALCAALATAAAAKAENVALIVAQENYQHYPRTDPDAILALAPRLRQAGFRTIVVRNLNASALAERMPEIMEQLVDAERFLVVTSGYYARLGNTSWLTTTDANRPGSFVIGRYGLSMEAIYDLAASRQGDAVIAAAVPSDQPPMGFRLDGGFPRGGVPNGVTVVSGTPRLVANFVAGDLLEPGRAILDAARAAPDGLVVTGYVPRNRAFLPAGSAPPAPPPVTPEVSERALWQQAASAGTVAGYERYLRRYPDGLFAAQARARISELTLSPEDRARREEEALNLGRDQRRRLQEYLTVLGFDTRGIDGVFGPNTRRAVSAWQRDIGANATGFLSANQVARIETQGAARAEQLRAEAERRRREEERRDRDYWSRTGARGEEGGLRAYLERYPDGVYADEAKRALRQIDRDKRQVAEAQERDDWDAAVAQGTMESFQQYLRDYPEGRFAAEARARITSLSEPETPPGLVEAARREEGSLRLDPFRARLIENQLDNMGLDPGPIDGNFTEETRRALRNFQRSTGEPVTGYVTRDTIVRLLVSALP